ncbi:MAG: lamin tail domain-containing protein [Myxococcota bacterium]
MRTIALLPVTALLLVSACADGGATEETPLVVPEGKEDNFLSRSAQEYLVEGQTTIVLEGADLALSDADKLERAKHLIAYKQVVVAWFLNAWIGPKDSEDKNFGYGGFNALTKNGSFEDLAIHKIDDKTYGFTTRQQLAGQLDLLDRLPVTHGADGKMTFDLVLGKVSNSDMQKLAAGAEWFREAPWEDFDPRKMDPTGLEKITLSITPQPRSLDGWIDTPKLFADGKVTIGVHFGWDYHDGAHIRSSKKLYAWLVKKGWKSPVASYDKLSRGSGPFTKTIMANKKPVKVELSMFWGKPGSTSDPDTAAGGKNLKADLIKSLETREVVIYSGHSGPFWGFSMANWNKTQEGELEDNELAGLKLPTSYQIVLAEGCETYAIGQAFFANPAKAERDNIDIVTTTTYSTAEDADPVVDFLDAVVGTSYGKHIPSTWGDLLQSLDWNSYDPALYGVHGIDDAPHLHPYADTSKFCATCKSDAACGAEGNFCANLGTDGKICTAACTGDDGCPDGYICAPIAKGASITGSACVPRNYSCSGGAPPTLAAIINEVMADPPNGDDGDLNGDGLIDPDGDEFVELYNASGKDLRLDGWTVADGTAVRYTFPTGTTIAKGQVAVVFGGGKASGLAGTGAKAFIAPSGLRLANSGDTVVVRNAAGEVVDRLVYGPEGGNDRSLVRAKDGDKASAFVAHPGSAVASPGLRTSGAPF